MRSPLLMSVDDSQLSVGQSPELLHLFTCSTLWHDSTIERLFAVVRRTLSPMTTAALPSPSIASHQAQ